MSTNETEIDPYENVEDEGARYDYENADMAIPKRDLFEMIVKFFIENEKEILEAMKMFETKDKYLLQGLSFSLTMIILRNRESLF